MAKYVIGIIVVILAGVLAFYAWDMLQPVQAPQQQEQQIPATATYASSTAGYAITYPTGFAVNEAYVYRGVPQKPIPGVSFTIPPAIAEGTNLAADTYLSVEQLPRAQSCTGDIFVLANVKASEQTMGSTTWSVATSSDAGAGNLYEEYVYAVKGSSPCTAVRYVVHSSNMGNFEPGAVREFDRQQLFSALDAIRDTLRLGSAAAQLANPASTNCVSLGGTLEIREGLGGQAGYCHLPDGRVCEEWALLRDEICVAPAS